MRRSSPYSPACRLGSLAGRLRLPGRAPWALKQPYVLDSICSTQDDRHSAAGKGAAKYSVIFDALPFRNSTTLTPLHTSPFAYVMRDSTVYTSPEPVIRSGVHEGVKTHLSSVPETLRGLTLGRSG